MKDDVTVDTMGLQQAGEMVAAMAAAKAGN